MSAEDCGTGLAGCVLHAAQLHGQEPAAVTGLALLGIGGGEWRAPGADVPAGPAMAKPQDAAAALEELIGGLKREFQSLGMFQRQ